MNRYDGRQMTTLESGALQTMSLPCTMCGLCYTRHGIAGPCFATDALLHLHHARLSVCHAVCWPATACHGKGSHVSTSTDRRVHLGKVLGLNGVQRLPHVMRHADICHLWDLQNVACQQKITGGDQQDK